MTNDMVRQKHSSGEENCSRLKSLEDDIDEVVDKDTVIDIKNDMVLVADKCRKRQRSTDSVWRLVEVQPIFPRKNKGNDYH
ncbi:unnamed protein product [Rhizophagus irregularis]|nr:unnamed protein product [Rhizophagus irregularis]